MSGQGHGASPARKRLQVSPGSPACVTSACRRILSSRRCCRILTGPMTALHCGPGLWLLSKAALSRCRNWRPVNRRHRRSVLTPSPTSTSNGLSIILPVTHSLRQVKPKTASTRVPPKRFAPLAPRLLDARCEKRAIQLAAESLMLLPSSPASALCIPPVTGLTARRIAASSAASE